MSFPPHLLLALKPKLVIFAPDHAKNRFFIFLRLILILCLGPFIAKAEEEDQQHPQPADATAKGVADNRLPPPSFIVTPPVQQTSTPNPKATTQNGPNQLQAFS